MKPLETTSQGSNCPVQTGFQMKREDSLDRKTLLLVEDDDDLRLIMESCLSSMGYRVVACSNAYAASTTFHTRVFDALVTDFEMPGKTGLELARELTNFKPHLPVLVITGSILSAGTLQELVDRQWIYMSKPSNLAAVESVLKNLVMVEPPFVT